ncbi:MAG TPA: hypothetical protein PK060_04845 [Polaromonas sp.]|jgi:hypothetical protein|nr:MULTISPECIES: hypothetical protein [unclassified Polaromonas]HQT06517.1 hypothetical protein [Polaromonas sp.]
MVINMDEAKLRTIAQLQELYLLGFFGAGTGSWLVGALRDVRGG